MHCWDMYYRILGNNMGGAFSVLRWEDHTCNHRCLYFSCCLVLVEVDARVKYVTFPWEQECMFEPCYFVSYVTLGFFFPSWCSLKCVSTVKCAFSIVLVSVCGESFCFLVKKSRFVLVLAGSATAFQMFVSPCVVGHFVVVTMWPAFPQAFCCGPVCVPLRVYCVFGGCALLLCFWARFLSFTCE